MSKEMQESTSKHSRQSPNRKTVIMQILDDSKHRVELSKSQSACR